MRRTIKPSRVHPNSIEGGARTGCHHRILRFPRELNLLNDPWDDISPVQVFLTRSAVLPFSEKPDTTGLAAGSLIVMSSEIRLDRSCSMLGLDFRCVKICKYCCRMAKVTVEFSLLLPMCNRRNKPSLTRLWINTGIVVVWCILLTGCAIPFWYTKNQMDTDKKPATPGQLVKPLIAKENKIGPSVKIAPETIKDEDGKTESGDSSSTKKTDNSRSSEETDSGDRDSGKKGSDASEPSKKDDTEVIEGPFKKHDHSKYTKGIKNAAIDTLNRDRSATYATLCRNTTTDLWTLTIYHQTGRKFDFTSYFWDEIDGKWDNAFDSGKLPLKRWKDHLRYSSSGKTCDILKGSHLSGKGTRR